MKSQTCVSSVNTDVGSSCLSTNQFKTCGCEFVNVVAGPASPPATKPRARLWNSSSVDVKCGRWPWRRLRPNITTITEEDRWPSSRPALTNAAPLSLTIKHCERHSDWCSVLITSQTAATPSSENTPGGKTYNNNSDEMLHPGVLQTRWSADSSVV